LSRWGMVIDLRRCIGCNACTVACKAEHGTPPGIFFTRVLAKEVGTYPAVKRLYIPVLCNHCQSAPCEEVCPTEATHRWNGGVVLVDSNKCMGCRACYEACPYQNRFYLDGDRVRLQPENSLMAPIYCHPSDVEVQGKVVAVLRTP